MNERIREFAEQADWLKPMGLPCDWDVGDYVVSPEQMEKFAELIVKRCVKICDERYVRNGNDGEGWLLAREIENHFGVEE